MTPYSPPFTGAAYVFVRSADTWAQQAYVKAAHPDSGDSFGEAVAIDDSRLYVGAPSEASPSRVINGDQLDNSSGTVGAVYVIR